MRNIKRIFLLLIFICASGIAAEDSKLPQVFDEVFKIHKALLEETSGKIDVKDLEKLLSSKSKVSEEEAVFKKALPIVKKLAKAEDLSDKRDLFASLSDSLSTLVVNKNKSGAGVFYCPMVKKKWIAKGDTITNPFDKEMRGCGEKVK